MAVRGQDIASVIKRQIEEFGGQLQMVDVGVVVEVGGRHRPSPWALRRRL